MHRVPFTKYTSFGNNFVIVDETQGAVLSEKQKQSFAYHATNGCFGIGSDNFIVIQRRTPSVLMEINETFGYWERPPALGDADFIFRMLEPDGIEALSCGNGLMCIARHLYHRYGIRESRIVTEIPAAEPRIVQIGVNGDGAYADLGQPRRIPEDLVCGLPKTQMDGVIERVDSLVIKDLRKTDEIEFLGDHPAIEMKGYLVFTGEPHFVVFVDGGIVPGAPVQYLFPGSELDADTSKYLEKRRSTGLAFVHFVGNHLNSHLKRYFPKGINVNFVRRSLREDRLLEYRCFERGIRKETLACGTGALACAFVYSRLKDAASDDITVWPYLCRVSQPAAQIKVNVSSSGWRIHGTPVLLVEGIFSP